MLRRLTNRDVKNPRRMTKTILSPLPFSQRKKKLEKLDSLRKLKTLRLVANHILKALFIPQQKSMIMFILDDVQMFLNRKLL